MPADLTPILSAVKLYLQVNYPEVSTGPAGSQGGAAVTEAAFQQLCMLALNNARKFAELQHDWRCEEVRVRATIPANSKVPMTALVDYWNAEETWDIKSLQSAYIVVDDVTPESLRPIEITTAKSWARKQMDIDDAYAESEFETRYRGEAISDFNSRLSQLIIMGDDMFLYPAVDEDVDIVLDGYKWLAEYEKSTSVDFFTQRGTAYLQFAAICEANLLAKTFVMRQEGNIAPPTRERDENLAVLINHDSYSVEGGAVQDL